MRCRHACKGVFSFAQVTKSVAKEVQTKVLADDPNGKGNGAGKRTTAPAALPAAQPGAIDLLSCTSMVRATHACESLALELSRLKEGLGITDSEWVEGVEGYRYKVREEGREKKRQKQQNKVAAASKPAEGGGSTRQGKQSVQEGLEQRENTSGGTASSGSSNSSNSSNSSSSDDDSDYDDDSTSRSSDRDEWTNVRYVFCSLVTGAVCM
jgi:hypothetical protein